MKTTNLNHQTPSSKPPGIPLADGWHHISLPSPSDPWTLQDEPLKAPLAETVGRHPFDLEERTALFGEGIVRFVKQIPRGPVNDRLIDQLVGAGTSVGGNFCEANDSESKKDFRHILKRCLKEAKESRYWLRLLSLEHPADG